jgi:hypothetical protein
MNDIFIHFVGFFRSHSRLRILGLTSALLVLWAAIIIPFSIFRYRLGSLVPSLLIFAATLGLSCLLSFTDFGLRKSDTDLELDRLRAEREEIKQRLASEQGARPDRGRADDIFGTIQLSLNQLTEYYTINKSQARNSFRFSVFAVVVGLATFISGVWLFYSGRSQSTHLSSMTE